MTTVTVSPKFQVVIPADVRSRCSINVGEKLHVLSYRGRIELIPVADVKKMRGAFKGLSTKMTRGDSPHR